MSHYCRICGKELTDPKSIALTIGPECAGQQAKIFDSQADMFRDKVTEPKEIDVTFGNTPLGYMSDVPVSVIQYRLPNLAYLIEDDVKSHLALNILNAFVPPGSDDEEPIPCLSGNASFTAFSMHQDFKQEFIEPMGTTGGRIDKEIIKAWILNKRKEL